MYTTTLVGLCLDDLVGLSLIRSSESHDIPFSIISINVGLCSHSLVFLVAVVVCVAKFAPSSASAWCWCKKMKETIIFYMGC